MPYKIEGWFGKGSCWRTTNLDMADHWMGIWYCRLQIKLSQKWHQRLHIKSPLLFGNLFSNLHRISTLHLTIQKQNLNTFTMPHHKLQSKWFLCTHSIILHRETHESELMRHSSKALSHMHKCRANMSKIPEVHTWDEYFLQEFPAGMTKPEKPHPQALSAADHRPVPHNLPLLKLVMLTMSITHATIDHKRR